MAMNRTQIMARLRKALGPTATYTHNPNAPDADERAALRAQSRELLAQLADAKERMDARRRELLSDPEYKRLFAEWSALERKRDEVTCKSFRYQVSVGRHNGLGTVVEAQGDTWAEVFAALEAKH
jgi:hypothetical protein